MIFTRRKLGKQLKFILYINEINEILPLQMQYGIIYVHRSCGFSLLSPLQKALRPQDVLRCYEEIQGPGRLL